MKVDFPTVPGKLKSGPFCGSTLVVSLTLRFRKHSILVRIIYEQGFYGVFRLTNVNIDVPSHIELPVSSVLGQVNGDNISDYKMK